MTRAIRPASTIGFIGLSETNTIGYYAAAAPVVPSANAAASFGFDREVDLAPMLERAFKERIDAGAIKTDKTPQELVRLHYRRIQ